MVSTVLTSNSAAVGFIIVIVAFFVCEQIGGVIIPALRRGGARVKRRNVGSNTMVIISWVAVIAFTVGFAKAGFGLLPDWSYYIGIAVMLVGIMIRQYAIAVLGRYFSQILGVQEEHKIVETGPYRLVRHPSYTGVLVFFVGMGLAVQSWAALFIDIAIFGLVYGYRIHVEEKVLVKELGNSYAQYMKRTKRLIPKII